MNIPKHILDYLIYSCRENIDVLNISYITSKKGLPVRYMHDLVIRKRQLKNPEKVMSLIEGILEYCDEVDIIRSKVEKVRDEINSQNKG
jgi:hypothetical protein